MRNLLIFSLILLRGVCLAQQMDTLNLTLKEADKLFLEKNLVVLANRANIDAAKALTEQARLWDNPIVSTSNGIFNTTTSKFNPQQVYIQVAQLFRLGQKRQKLVDVQIENEHLTEAQFNDLMRNLRYTLHTTYYRAATDFKTIELISNEQISIQNLLNQMQPLVASGNVVLKDYVRIQTIGYMLEQDLLAAKTDLNLLMTDLKTLLQINNTNVIIKPTEVLNTNLSQNTGDGVGAWAADSLMSEAVKNRADLQAAYSQINVAQKSVVYQKSLVIPDLAVNMGYDPVGNFATSGFSFGLSIPLPILNKNQGNIKAAQIAVEQNKNLYQAGVVQAQNQVISTYLRLQDLENATRQDKNDYFKSFEKLMQNVVNLYKTKQVSLLDFVDMFESYKDARTKRIQTEQSYLLTKEELNYQVGKQIF